MMSNGATQRVTECVTRVGSGRDGTGNYDYSPKGKNNAHARTRFPS